LDGAEVLAGGGVEVAGRLSHGGKDVEIDYSHGDAVFNFTVTTDGSGRFNHTFTPGETGDWQVHARFAGDEACLPAESETLNFTVTSLSTSLTCAVSDGEIELRDEVTISGAFSLERAGLKVELTMAAGKNMTRISAETALNGSFRAVFKPDLKGTWKIQAKVAGDGFLYEGSESAVAELTVVGPSLTTRLHRLPPMLIRPPYLYGVLGAIGGTTGGVVFYIRRRE